MKTIKYFLAFVLAVCAVACNDGIDSITSVASGPDETAPTVKILYPAEGALIQVTEDVASINIRVDAVDDIELESLIIQLDGAEIAKFTEFKDYRHALVSYTYDQLTNGKHTLTAIAKDLTGKTTTESVNFEKAAPYKPKFEGEIFYMPFNGDYMELVSVKYAATVGNPLFISGKSGQAYAGAADAYLTFPTSGLLGSSFTAAFWYKMNDAPDRSGILIIGPVDEANPDMMNNRKSGFRFFRESGNGGQTLKLNVGDGAEDSWFDGGETATLTSSDWVHVAFTISDTECVVYFNGEVVCQNTFSGVNWDGCDIMTIGSGAPRFTEWGHMSDQSLMDELRLFNKALTSEEIKEIME